jgi:hypothetical protein
MEELAAYRADLLSALDGVVEALGKMVAAFLVSEWYQPVNPSGQTPHYVLFHLGELESQVFSAQLPRFLAENTPILPVFNDEDWMAAHYHPEQSPSAILEQLDRLRHQELAWLGNLPPAGWSRLARHPWWGLHALQWWVELQVEYSNQSLRELSSVLDL